MLRPIALLALLLLAGCSAPKASDAADADNEDRTARGGEGADAPDPTDSLTVAARVHLTWTAHVVAFEAGGPNGRDAVQGMAPACFRFVLPGGVALLGVHANATWSAVPGAERLTLTLLTIDIHPVNETAGPSPLPLDIALPQPMGRGLRIGVDVAGSPAAALDQEVHVEATLDLSGPAPDLKPEPMGVCPH